MMRRAWIYLAIVAAAAIAAAVQAEPWPLSPTNAEHKIYTGYGHFAEDTGGTEAGFHFHEGIDIDGADGVNVLAIADGLIRERFVVAAGDKYAQYFTVTFSGDSTNAWGYVHIRFANNPATGVTWAVGDTVNTGNTLGVVDALSGGAIFSHLHLERDNNADGWSSTGTTSVAALAGDPLEAMNPNTDTVDPTITSVHYRKAEDENVKAATYRTVKIDNKTVVFNNVDIIFKGHDKFKAFTVPLAAHKFGFDLVEKGLTVTTEEFTGAFIDPPNVFSQFRNKDLAQVYYEHDDSLKSNQNLSTGATNVFYYIATNKDDDDKLELTDRDHYWNTDIRDDGGGVNKWNTKDAAGNDARINEEALFGDGRHKVKVKATDEDTVNNETTKEDSVVVDNFIPYVKKVTIGNPVRYLAEWEWDGTAATLTFNKSVDLYIPEGDHQVEIIFSEPVKSPKLQISTYPTELALSSTEPHSQQITWTGTLEVRAADASHDGQQTMTITAKDLADNDIDGKPASIPSRNAAEVFTDTDDGGKKDESHKPKIDSQPPAINITVTQ